MRSRLSTADQSPLAKACISSSSSVGPLAQPTSKNSSNTINPFMDPVSARFLSRLLTSKQILGVGMDINDAKPGFISRTGAQHRLAIWQQRPDVNNESHCGAVEEKQQCCQEPKFVIELTISRWNLLVSCQSAQQNQAFCPGCGIAVQ